MMGMESGVPGRSPTLAARRLAVHARGNNSQTAPIRSCTPASVWTRRLGTAHRVARALRAGTVWVNTFDASDVITPFGGFKDSGSGRDKSLHALDAYSALKTTWIHLGDS